MILGTRGMTGKHHTIETKIKLSKAFTGKHHSLETRKKISDANKGKPHSEEMKRKMSIAMCGKPSPRKGMPLSEEHRKNISLGRKGIVFSEEHRKKLSKNNCMKRPEIVQKMISSCSGTKNHNYGRLPKHGIKAVCDSPLQGQVNLRSSWELAYAKYLDTIGELWVYEVQTFAITNGTYIPDFFLPRLDKFIEIKGFLSREAETKIRQFREEYPFELEVLRRNDLLALGCIC